MSGTAPDPWPQGPSEARRRRRRRARGGRGRGLHLLPNLFTTGNLFFGFYTIVQASLGNAEQAALGIVLAMLFDIFDGRVARLAKVTSRFGGEYDSLADVVSFGVAPAILAFSAGDLRLLGRAGWVLAFLYVACAAMRLARFNVAPSRYSGRFEGLPSPAAAGMIATTQWFVDLAQTAYPWSVPPLLVAHRNRRHGPVDGEHHSVPQLQGDRPAPFVRHAGPPGLRDHAGGDRAQHHPLRDWASVRSRLDRWNGRGAGWKGRPLPMLDAPAVQEALEDAPHEH